jgi:dUTP pyrophosphatase
VVVRFRRLDHALDLPAPAVASALSAGADLRAAVASAAVLEPGGRLLVPTGIAIEIPAGWEGQVRPRSGLAAEHGVTVLNAPGTIDADYRGEVAVLLINHGSAPYTVRRGDRIAQIVIAPAAAARWEETTELSASARGAGGFGSTGSR